eukprot:1034845_1
MATPKPKTKPNPMAAPMATPKHQFITPATPISAIRDMSLTTRSKTKALNGALSTTGLCLEATADVEEVTVFSSGDTMIVDGYTSKIVKNVIIVQKSDSDSDDDDEEEYRRDTYVDQIMKRAYLLQHGDLDFGEIDLVKQAMVQRENVKQRLDSISGSNDSSSGDVWCHDLAYYKDITARYFDWDSIQTNVRSKRKKICNQSDV